MRKTIFVKNYLFGLLPISLSIGVLFGVNCAPAEELHGYDGVKLTTMDIDLNDSTETEISNYYSKLNSLEDEECNGTNLLKNLKQILKEDQLYFSYDTDKLWNLYEITDRDWVQSPAVKLQGYNATANVIKDYTFGKSNPIVRTLYSDHDILSEAEAHGDHGNDSEWGFQQEHIWAKSHGFDSLPADETNGGARGDPMHLWPGQGYANVLHSNDFFGYVDTTRTVKDTNTKFITTGHNLHGYSKTYPESSYKVFEPQDSDKGDIARACFYMAARYNNFGNEGNVFNGNEPNLILNDELNLDTGTSSADKPFNMGILTDLLEWNKIDPPDEFEIHRNNLLYKNFTHNRNPFIDYPQWADIAFGGSTNIANPSEDKINGDGSTVALRSISVTKKPTKLEYLSGEAFDPSGMEVTAFYSDGSSAILNSDDYSFSPNTALKSSNKKIVISSKNKKTTSVEISVTPSAREEIDRWELVTSSNQLIDGDEYTIVSTKNSAVLSMKQDLMTENYVPSVEVNKKVEDDIECIEISDETLCFTLEELENNTVAFTTDNQYLSINTLKSPFDQLRLSNEIVDSAKWTVLLGNDCKASVSAISHNDKKQYIRFNSSADYGFRTYDNETTVNDVFLYHHFIKEAGPIVVTNITLDKTNVTLDIDESLLLNATVLPTDATDDSITWSSSDSDIVTVSDEGLLMAKSGGTATITAKSNSNENVVAQCVVNVPFPIVLDSIIISKDSNPKTEYYVGDSFSFEGIKVLANYTQNNEPYGDPEDVTEFVEYSGFDMENAGEYDVLVKFNDKKATFKITVKEVPTIKDADLFIFSQGGFANAQKITYWEVGNFKLIPNKGIASSNNSPKYYDYESSFRIYNGNTFMIMGSKKITGVEFVFCDSDVENSCFTVDKGTCDSITGLWKNGNGVDSLTYTTTAARRISQIIVQYDPNSTVEVSLEFISLSGNYKTDYIVGEELDLTGLNVIANYSNLTSKEVTNYQVSSVDMSTSGTKVITISYTEGNITKEAYFDILVESNALLTYKKITGKIEEGDYIIVNSGYAMTGFAVESKLDKESCNIENNEIVSNNKSIVWRIRKNGEFYNLFNLMYKKYLKITSGKLELIENSDKYCLIDLNTVGSILRSNYTIGFYNDKFSQLKSNSNNFEFYRLENSSFAKSVDVNELKSADKIVFGGVYNSTSSYLATNYDANSHQLCSQVINSTNDILALDFSANVYTVEESNGKYSFKSSDGYLTYIISDNRVGFADDNLNENSKFDVSYSSNEGWIISNNNHNLVFDYSGGNPLFKFASNVPTNCKLEIYQSVECAQIDSWSKEFLKSTKDCVVNEWDSLKLSYNLLSDEAKNYIVSVESDQNEFASYASQAMARYEYILSDDRFNKAESPLDQFIGNRSIPNAKKDVLLGVKNIDSSIIVIISLSIIGIVSVGGYFFYRTKEEVNG